MSAKPLDLEFLEAMPADIKEELLRTYGAKATKSGRISKRPATFQPAMLVDRRNKKKKIRREHLDEGEIKPKNVQNGLSSSTDALEELDLDMVYSRLDALPDVESKYVVFIQEHITKLDQQVEDMMESVVQVTSEKMALEKILENQEAAAESQIDDLKMINTELEAENRQLKQQLAAKSSSEEEEKMEDNIEEIVKEGEDEESTPAEEATPGHEKTARGTLAEALQSFLNSQKSSEDGNGVKLGERWSTETETAETMRTAEEHTIIGDLNAEQEAFEEHLQKSTIKETNAPWIGVSNETLAKKKILDPEEGKDETQDNVGERSDSEKTAII